MISFNRQTGTASVEYAIGGLVFFVVILLIIEVGRGLFAWNAMAEVTRRAARVAAVCPVNHSAIARVALFNGPTDGSNSSLVPGLAPANIEIRYLDEDGGVLGNPNGSFSQIEYVRARIVNFQYQFLIPRFIGSMGGMNVATPDFVATLPRESLGVPREGAGAECFGTSS